MESKTILIVDDMEINRAILRQLFQQECQVLEAENGQVALQALEEHPQIDLVILDIVMPVMDGFATLQALRGQPRYAKLPVIICTEHADVDIQVRALDLGSTDFITKPFNAQVVRHRVLNLIQMRQMEIRLAEQQRAIHRKTEVALRDTDQRLKSLINAVPGGIITFEMSAPPRITYFNDTACDIVGLTRAEFETQAERDLFALVHPADISTIRELIQDYIAHPRSSGATFRILRKDRSTRWIRLSGVPISSAEGTLTAICVCTDVSAEKESALQLEHAFQEMRYRSEHDALTDLWNRDAFHRRTHEALIEKAQVPHVLLSVNIHRFKMINEFFGAHVGDEVLRLLAGGLRDLFDGVGTYGRMEADHFIACFPASALNMDRIMAVLDQKLTSQSYEYHIELFFGLYEITDPHMAVDQMCDRAAMALKTIKGSAVKRYAYYDDSMRQTLVDEQSIAEEMHDALAGGQFVPYLQPIYSLKTLQPVSAEVLVRWQHPEKGLIPPGKFIPLFERNGFVTKLDFAVWEQACALLSNWTRQGVPAMPLSINISRIDLYHPHLCEELVSLLQRYDLDPSLLKLEITESAYIDDPTVLAAVIRRFRAAGFRILMDDFGSGYSSLNTLKDMPINVLKIDMCFLAELENSPRAASILVSVAGMARRLNIPVIVEGVETQAQLDFLASIGCDEGQGYFFSRPLPVADFEALLRSPKAIALSGKPTFSLPAQDGETDAGELLQMERQYRKAFLADALFVFDMRPGENRFQLLHAAEDAAERFYPCTQYLLSPENHQAFHPDDLAQIKWFHSPSHLAQLMGQGRDEARVQVRIKDLKGDWVWVEVAMHLLEGGTPSDPRYLLHIKVVDHLKRAEDELRTRADIDPVSSLFTRRAVQEQISQRLETPTPGVTQAFFLMDIDNFKHVNDTYGHAVGDEVILAIGQTLRHLFRSCDLVGRLGGDEYVVFMASPLGESLVRMKAERVLSAISGIVTPAHPELRLSLSIGISLCPQHGTAFDALYQNADKALYTIKALGKDSYAFYGEQPAKTKPAKFSAQV